MPLLKGVVFWLLFIIGGAFFVLLTIRANKVNKANENTIWGKSNILRSLPLVYKGELTWIVCWILGIIIYPSRLSYIMGIFPLLMPLLTLGSILMIYINEGLKNNREKGYVKPCIMKWAKQLPPDFRVSSVNYSLHRNHNIINGRVIIHLYSKSDIDEVNWDYFGGLLEQDIDQPIIIQIKLNDKNIYPILLKKSKL